MSKRNRTEKTGKKVYVYKFFVVLLLLGIAAFILNVAPNYIRNEVKGKVSFIINNNNVTERLKNDVIIESDSIYVSEEDMRRYFDNELCFDEDTNQIITTSDTKIAVIPMDSRIIKINDANVEIYAQMKTVDGKRYIPFSEICKNVYNIEAEYISKTNTVIAVSLDRELTYANSSKKNSVKYKPTVFSKTVDKIAKGDNVTVIPQNEKDAVKVDETTDSQDKEENKWTKITTKNGKIGYVKTSTLANVKKVRDNLTLQKQIEGKISLVWDYFSEYKKAPKRTESIEGVNVVSPSFINLKNNNNGDIDINIGNEGIEYINWAHKNGYRVWAIATNNVTNYNKKNMSDILSNYTTRENLINNLVKVAERYDIDGINIDFENIYEKDKDNYSRFIIELAPRLREIGKVLSVDVTAPDGASDWSLCFDRNKIAKAADYIVFMAYDQHSKSSKEPGTNAGYNWIENNLKKFVNVDRENVESDKLILALPFYTRIWKQKGDELKCEDLSMKNTSKSIPSNATIKWDETLHQNYAEFTGKDNYECKIWIEDVKSIVDKLKLINDYNLAGAAYWRKDMEDSDVWPEVKKALFNE